MGKLVVEGKEYTTPVSEMTVKDIKELAGVPEEESLYKPDESRVLNDKEKVSTEDTELGVLQKWDRG